MFLPEKGYKRIVVITFYAALSLICAYLFFKYLLSCILPFAVAFLIAGSTRKYVLFLSSKLGISRFFSVLIITLSVLGLSLALVYWIFSSAFSELSGLTVYLTETNIATMFSDISDSLYNILSKISPGTANSLKTQFFEISKNIEETVSSIINRFLPQLANIALAVIKTFPKILLFTGVTLLSLFYFACDYERITHFVFIQFSEGKQKLISELKKQFISTVFSTIRAYAILIFITFAELLTGFIIIGIPYATVLASVISIIDILPVLGTGTVLVPWSLISFINGNTRIGLSILVLYVIITVIRQIAEPKILGVSLGLHPLVTLISMYFGVKLAGIVGLFAFPFIAIIVKNLNEKQCISLYKNPELTDSEKDRLAKKKYKSFKQSDLKE